MNFNFQLIANTSASNKFKIYAHIRMHVVFRACAEKKPTSTGKQAKECK